MKLYSSHLCLKLKFLTTNREKITGEETKYFFFSSKANNNHRRWFACVDNYTSVENRAKHEWIKCTQESEGEEIKLTIITHCEWRVDLVLLSFKFRRLDVRDDHRESFFASQQIQSKFVDFFSLFRCEACDDDYGCWW